MTVGELPLEAMGPKMVALGDARRQRFAWLMACGDLNATAAARTAGYSDAGGGAKVRAHELMHNPLVLDAIEEASRNVLRGLGPLAIRAARRILEDKKHPAHARMIEAIMDRTGHAGEQKISVEHSVNTKDLEDFARRLALEEGIDPRRFLGVNGPGLIEHDAGAVVEADGKARG